MSKNITVDAEIREGKNTRGELNAFRAASKLPAVVYGGDKPPQTVVVPLKALRAALQEGGANAILTLKHAKGEDTVILKEVTHDVVTEAPLHADFQRISLKEKVHVKIHVKLVGEAPGVKTQGGILEHAIREIEVTCLPNAIPSGFELDISKLNITESLHIRDIQVPKDVELEHEADQIVVNIVAPRVAEETPAEGAEGEAAEPDVIAKGKKEEEGEGESEKKKEAEKKG